MPFSQQIPPSWMNLQREGSKTAQGYTELEASSLAVGLPDGLMGNSEVGHLNIGAGRVVWQDVSLKPVLKNLNGIIYSLTHF